MNMYMTQLFENYLTAGSKHSSALVFVLNENDFFLCAYTVICDSLCINNSCVHMFSYMHAVLYKAHDVLHKIMVLIYFMGWKIWWLAGNHKI